MAYQTVTPTLLGRGAVAATLTTRYTVPASTRTFVKDICIANTTGGALTVDVHFVPTAGTAGTDNAILYGVSIAANSTLQWTGNQILDAGDFIQDKGSSTGLTINISGGEAT